MRIRMVIYVDVDEKSWAEDQGVERKGVREDVTRYVRGSVRELPLIKEHELRSGDDS